MEADDQIPDEQIRAIEHEIVSGQTPEAINLAWKWMLRGLSNQEITRWLKIVEKDAIVSVAGVRWA